MKCNKKMSGYQKIMLLGKQCGCHQMKERSFFIHGKQLPVCARCSGVFVGNIIAYIVYSIYVFSINIYLLGCAVIFLDWFIQYVGIKESTNIRRLITGIIGGYSFTSLQCITLWQIAKQVLKVL